MATPFRRYRTAIPATMKRILCVLYLVLTCSMLSGPIIYNLARWLTGQPLHWSSLIIGPLLAAGLLWVSSRLWDRWPPALAWVTIGIGGVLLRKALLLHQNRLPMTATTVTEATAMRYAMAMVASALIVSAAAFLIQGAIHGMRHRHSQD